METGGNGSSEAEPRVQKKQPESTAPRLFERISERWHSLSDAERIYITQLGLIAAIRAVDAFSTYVGFNTVSHPHETNEMARSIIDQYGFLGLQIANLALSGGEVAAIEGVRRKLKLDTRGMGIALTAGNAFMATFPIHNTLVAHGLPGIYG